MKIKVLIIIAIVAVSTFVVLSFSNLQKNTCESMDGRWNNDHCIIREESFGFKKNTFVTGTVFVDRTCYSNGIKFVLESFAESIPNTNHVKVMRSPAYDICMDLALECDYENSSTSFVGIKKGNEIIVPLYLEGRGQNYTIYLDAFAVENMDGSYIKNIEVTTEDNPVDYSVDKHGKIDLFSMPLPIDEKYNFVDYGMLGYLVAEHDLRSKLAEKDIAYSEENYTFQDGFSLDSYPPHSSYCALVKSDKGEDYWYEGGFHRDTLTRSELSDENPNSCEPNSFSCTCSIIKQQAIEDVGDLSYFDKVEEEFVGKALQKYLTETKVSNVPNQFVVGKYNFDYDGEMISFCGKFVEPSTRNTFEGAVLGSKVTSFSMRPSMELCAISDDVAVYEFRYLGNED